MKRILDCRGSDFRQMGKKELKQAVRAAEGRTILAETVVTSQPLLPEVSNPEVNHTCQFLIQKVSIKTLNRI
jgi:hypothetical protein